MLQGLRPPNEMTRLPRSWAWVWFAVGEARDSRASKRPRLAMSGRAPEPDLERAILLQRNGEGERAERDKRESEQQPGGRTPSPRSARQLTGGCLLSLSVT
mgnify:CR=1 FL=1